MDPIFHITSTNAWLAAQRIGHYEGDTLSTDGFVHCSFVHQVASVVNAVFRGRAELIVLEIDQDLVNAQIRIEDGFPHVYGPIRVEAIANVHELVPGPDGFFSFP